MSPTLFVVVPVFNEAGNLERLLEALRDSRRRLAQRGVLTVVMVDDGSSDGTAERARGLAGDLPMTVLEHGVNRGPGAAFGTAFEHLSTRVTDGNLVATMEGDNTSRHELLEQMLTRLAEGYDLVLASPYAYGGGFAHTSSSRLLLSHVANSFAKEALGIRGLMTISSFYRLHRGAFLRRLWERYGPRIVERAGFESMVELLVKSMFLHARISEVEMNLDSSRRVGPSKMKIVKTSLGYLTLYKDLARWRRANGATP